MNTESRIYKKIKNVDAYVSVIKDEQQTARLVKELSCELPLNELLHLKRVRRHKTKDSNVQVIVCSKASAESILDVMTSFRTRFPTLGKPSLMKVPEKPPKTRTQYQEARNYWPVSFHEDKRITSLLSGQYFSSVELKKIHTHMKSAIRLAQFARSKQQIPLGAVIVDPVSDTVLAQSYDMRKGNNSLQHAVMAAVDLVAHSQGGGMWSILDSGMTDKMTDSATKSGPYLCTGYDLYVNTEPCIMCAMALVHSRISRVFYGCPHPEGALGSRYKLHVQPGLNHHYQVFRGVRMEECQKLMDT